MSDDDFERRIKNSLEAIVENQARFNERQAQFDARQVQFDARQAQFDARQVQFEERQIRFDENMTRLQEAVVGMIQVARTHDGQIDRNSEQIAELKESLQKQRETVDTLLRVVEAHITNHS